MKYSLSTAGILAALTTGFTVQAAPLNREVVDFENGSTPTFLTTPDASNGSWAITDQDAKSGTYSLVSGSISTLEAVTVQWSGEFAKGWIFFDAKVDTANSNLLTFDHAKSENISDGQWNRYSYPIEAGVQTLGWTYKKLANQGTDADKVWIDNLVFIAQGHDGDNDGMDDYSEYLYGLDFSDPTDASKDADNDGLTNLEEIALGTSPNKADTDGDGHNDNVELGYGLDPLNAMDVWIDTDGDRLPLILEKSYSLDEANKDNDVFSNQFLLIELAYTGIRHQFAYPGELGIWNNLLNDGYSLLDLYSGVLNNEHFDNMAFVGRVYQAIMQRSPDLAGLNHHRSMLSSGGHRQSVVDVFVDSPEFQSLYGSLSNREFVSLIYQNVFGRAADEAGLDYWAGQLNSNLFTTKTLMLHFIESAEYISKQDVTQRVDALSLVMTGALPNSEDRIKYKFWLTDEGNPKSVIKALLGSNGYRQSLKESISAATDDTDNDGIPDGVEFALGSDGNLKNNDVNSDDTMFVKQMLRDVTGEAWSDKEVTTQLAALTTATSRTQWIKQLFDSQKVNASREAISRLYSASFLRRPDYAGLTNWIARHDSDLSLRDMADIFVASEEFQTRYGSLSNADFVNLVYQNVMSRFPESEGMTYWQGRLDSGDVSRGGMMIEFSESQENLLKSQYRDKVVVMFNLLHRRAPTEDEYTTWFDALSTGTDDSLLIEAIVNSNEYQARFY